MRLRRTPLFTGLGLLIFAWSGPLPGLAAASFTAHMVLHLTVVAVASPLIALGLPDLPARLAAGPLAGLAPLAAAPAAAAIEMVVVWGWHAPALCGFARATTTGLILEQVCWLAVGLLLWTSALATARPEGHARGGFGPWAGVLALLLTSMHMILLGTLLALAPMVLYESFGRAFALGPLDDQRLGGTLMMAVGGGVYLLGGLALIAKALRDPTPTPPATASRKTA